LLRGKATGLGLPSLRRTGLGPQRTKHGQPHDEIASGPFELAPLHLHPTIPSALLDHVTANEDKLRLDGFVLVEGVAQHRDGTYSLPRRRPARSSTKAPNSVRRCATRSSGWFGPKPSGNQSSLVGPERAWCRLLQIIVDNSAEAERKVGADVNC
jgi:hypothetical protein